MFKCKKCGELYINKKCYQKHTEKCGYLICIRCGDNCATKNITVKTQICYKCKRMESHNKVLEAAYDIEEEIMKLKHMIIYLEIKKRNILGSNGGCGLEAQTASRASNTINYKKRPR